MSGRQSGSGAVGSHGIAPHEVLVLNALRRLLELGPAMMHTIAGWSGFGTTQPSSGATNQCKSGDAFRPGFITNVLLSAARVFSSHQ